jgi:hypothetical protein
MVDPMVMNRTENPRINDKEWERVLMMTCLFLPWDMRVSNELPLMKETYDGKRPRQQGERKDKTPAAKAR